MIELDYKEIGQNIRKFRQEKDMKQKELAERINMSEQHISHIESAHTKLSLPTLIAIANVLEVDCNSLLGDTLTGSINTILFDQIIVYLSKMDQIKLKLVSEICRLVVELGTP